MTYMTYTMRAVENVVQWRVSHVSHVSIKFELLYPICLFFKHLGFETVELYDLHDLH